MAALALSCGRQALGPGVNSPSLTPADTNRNRLVGHLLAPSLARTFATVDALRGRGALPFGSNELRSMLAARLGIPVEVLELVDTGKPLALALVNQPTPAPGDPGLLAGACTLRPAEGGAALAALGAPVSSRKDAHELRRPDGGSLWVIRSGLDLVWADSFEALAEAGAHAALARGDAGDDIVVRAFPPALAAWQGADLRQGPAGLKAQLLRDYDQSFRERDRPPPPPAERAAYEALLDFALAPLPDTTHFDVAVGLAETRGLRFGLKALPRPGSAFAKRLETPTPVAHEPALLEGSTQVALAEIGPSPTLPLLIQTLLDAQARAGVPGAQSVATRVRALTPLLSGAMGSAARGTGTAGITQDLVLSLRPGVDGRAALEALAAVASDPGLPALLQAAYGSQAPALTITRDNAEAGPALRLQLAFPADARPRGIAALASRFFGTNTVVLTVTSAGNRLLAASEPGARDRLRKLAAGGGTPAPGSAVLATALEESRGREGFLFLDLWGLARPLLPAMVSGREGRMLETILAVPGLADLDLHVWASHRGGRELDAELRVPLATLTQAASALGLLGQATGLNPVPAP